MRDDRGRILCVIKRNAIEENVEFNGLNHKKKLFTNPRIKAKGIEILKSKC